MAGIETQYLLPASVGAQAARKLLAAHLDVEDDRPRSVDRRYYDTFDGRLHGEGLTLVHEDGRLELLDRSGHARSVAEQRLAPRHLFVSELAGGPLRQLLEPVVEVRALSPIARVRSRVQPIRVLDDEAKTVARLVLEEPELVAPGGARTRLEPRVRVLPVRGYDDELKSAREVLERELELTEAGVSIRVEAVAAAGGSPGGFSSKLEPRHVREEPAAHAAAHALAGPLGTMRATLPGTVADLDIEFLHDFRVAVRRTRSLQRQLAPVFPAEQLDRFRADFRWLQQVTGTVRDLDVHQLELARFRAESDGTSGADLEALAKMLAQRRQREFRKMARALKSSRTNELLERWSEFLADLPEMPEEDRPDARRPIAELASERVQRVYRRMVKMGRAIDDESPAEALHALRKKGKELRYLLEFFAGLYPDEVIKPMVRRLKGLQDVLGRYQDQEIQADTLRGLGNELAGREGGAAALMALGLLVRNLDQDHAAARAEFEERFGRFASKSQRKLVKETFS
jgi:CHAD domain-containing protein